MSLGFRLTRRSRLILYPGLATPIDSVVALIIDGGEAVMIDSGSGLRASVEALAVGLAGLGYPDRFRVGLVINTHGHVMNAGGDWWAHEVLKATIAARPPDSNWIESGDPVRTGAREVGVVFRGTPVGLVLREDLARIPVGDLEVEVVHTPGHTPGSQSVFLDDDQRLALIGDSLASISPRWDSSEEDWWRSLEKIRERDPDIICDSVRCYMGKAAKSFLEQVEREGPRRIE